MCSLLTTDELDNTELQKNTAHSEEQNVERMHSAKQKKK